MASNLDVIKAKSLPCSFCGQCVTVCPVFEQQPGESYSARGRMLLMRYVAEGKVPPNDVVAHSLHTCTLCMACKAKCATKIPTTDLFIQYRNAMSEKVPLPLAKRVAFTGLTYRRLFDACLAMGKVFQGVLLKKARNGPGYFSRFPIPAAGLNQRRLLPSLAAKPLHALVPEVSSPGVGRPRRARVAFFPGCMLRYVYPEAGKAVIDVLTHNGIEVVLPKKFGCCGTPAITSGDFGSGEALARNNLEVLTNLRGVDAIITACATCGTALQHEYGLMLDGNNPLRSVWEALAGKVQDFTQFLQGLGLADDFKPLRRKITYHDACHLVRGMQVAAQPRALLKAIPGVEFVEMHDADRCCGCAGTFSATNYELSSRINDNKISNIRETGAEAVISGCSACNMHIQDGLRRNNVRATAMHTAQFLAEAYGLR